MQCKVIAPTGYDQWDAGVGIRSEHAFVGNPHGVDEVWFDAFDGSTQALRRAANRQRSEPLPNGGTQAHRPGGSGARALRRFLNRTKGNGCKFKALNGEIQFTLKCGGDMNLVHRTASLVHRTASLVHRTASLVAALCEVTDPVGGYGGTGINNVENFHALELYVIARTGETRYISCV